MTKYIKVEWPEYQTYMEHPQFRELSYYNSDNNIYFIPENLIEEVDVKLRFPKIYEDTHIGTVTCMETHAIVNGEYYYWYNLDNLKSGDEVLVYDHYINNWLITTCVAVAKGLPIILEDKNLLEGINCEIVGVKHENREQKISI